MNSNISEYQSWEGTFNFNATPLAPPDIRALFYNTPTVQKPWVTRGGYVLYVGP